MRNQPPTKKVLVVDDHGLLLDSIRFYLERDPDYATQGVGTKSEALSLISDQGPFDAILADMMLPDATSAADHKELIDANNGAPVVLISAFICEKEIETAKNIGMRGFIPKLTSASELLDAVKKVIDGATVFPETFPIAPRSDAQETQSSPLNEFEAAVMDLLRSGLSNAKIAQKLSCRINLVERSISSIYKKLGVRTRLQAALKEV